MSVNMLSMLKRFALVFLCLPLLTVQAEMGKGTVENPVTREYTRGAYKDWQEGTSLDSETGNFIVTYKAWNGHFNSVIFEPATKIDPTLKSKYKSSDSGNTVGYEYKLRNSTKAKQNIEMFLTHVSSISGNQVDPPDWDGRAFPTLTDTNLRLSWTHKSEGLAGGLAPGKTADGFKLESSDLPGVVIMKIMGNARATTWLGHMPPIDTPVGRQVAFLESVNHVQQLAAAPRIQVPTPFDAAVVLANIQNHLDRELKVMQLVDASLTGKLDQMLVAAIAAAKGGNTAALKSHLKELRQLLKGHYGEIDKEDDDKDGSKNNDKENSMDKDRKLVAKVLDFDLKYIQRRLGYD